MKTFYLVILTIYFSCSFDNAISQDADTPDPIANVVTLDLVGGDVKDRGIAPFDVPIIFEGEVPDSMSPAGFHMFLQKNKCPLTPTLSDSAMYVGPSTLKRQSLFGRSQLITFRFLGKEPKDFDSLQIPQEFLVHDRHYCLIIRKTNNRQVPEHDQQLIRLRTPSTLADFFQLDFGLGYAFKPQAIVGFVSLHVYAVPINRSTDLSDNMSDIKQFLRRTSFFVCLAPLTVHSWAKSDIKQADGIGNIGFGIGYRAPFYGRLTFSNNSNKRARRILQPMRINFGWMHYTQADANPVITKTRSKWTPFMNMTFDFNISSVFGPVAKIFGAI